MLLTKKNPLWKTKVGQNLGYERGTKRYYKGVFNWKLSHIRGGQNEISLNKNDKFLLILVIFTHEIKFAHKGV